MKSKLDHTMLAILIGLPGALLVGFYGFVAVIFSGDASPSSFGSFCWFFWGTVGGACVGAIPGLIWGLLHGVRWVIPFFGAAVGTLLSLLLTPTLQARLGFGMGIDLGGLLCAWLVLLGFLAGIGLLARIGFMEMLKRRRAARGA